jgi:hypothetical protein
VTKHQYDHPIIELDRAKKDEQLGEMGYGADTFGTGYYTSQNKDVIEGYKNTTPDSYVRKQRLPRGTRVFLWNDVSEEDADRIIRLVSKRYYNGWLDDYSDYIDLPQMIHYNESLEDVIDAINTAINRKCRAETQRLRAEYRAICEEQEQYYKKLEDWEFGKVSFSSQEKQFIEDKIAELEAKLEPYYSEEDYWFKKAARFNEWQISPIIAEMGYDAIEYLPNTRFKIQGINNGKGNNILVINPDVINNPRQFTLERMQSNTGNP